MTTCTDTPLSDIDSFKARLDTLLALESTRRIIDEAEAIGAFPREIIALLGREGIFAAKWGEHPLPALEHARILSERFGRLGCGGIASAVTLHDSAIAMLRPVGSRAGFNSAQSSERIGRSASRSLRRSRAASR